MFPALEKTDEQIANAEGIPLGLPTVNCLHQRNITLELIPVYANGIPLGPINDILITVNA